MSMLGLQLFGSQASRLTSCEEEPHGDIPPSGSHSSQGGCSRFPSSVCISRKQISAVAMSLPLRGHDDAKPYNLIVCDTAHVASTGVFLLGASQACALQLNGIPPPTLAATLPLAPF